MTLDGASMKESEALLQFIKKQLRRVNLNLDSYETVTNRMIYNSQEDEEWLKKELIRDAENAKSKEFASVS